MSADADTPLWLPKLEAAARLSILTAGLAAAATTSAALLAAPAPNLFSTSAGWAGIVFFGTLCVVFLGVSIFSYFEAAMALTSPLASRLKLIRGPLVVLIGIVAFLACLGMPIAAVWLLVNGGLPGVMRP
ncbi:MAG: hypothetical protein AAF919_18250 [Pseudomonadota bacterium]